MRELTLWIGKRLVGYPEDLLTVLVATAFAGRNVLVVGKHGLGKSALARCLAEALDASWVHYDAAKDDLVSIAGMPDSRALGEGRLVFARHPRTIWDKRVVLIDEITRANRENQRAGRAARVSSIRGEGLAAAAAESRAARGVPAAGGRRPRR